jgi:polar amino acid transport system ATP-binding protein
MVFQNFNLIPQLTATENVALGPAEVLGVPRGDATRRAHELLDRVGLADRREHYPAELSGGQQQRVAIARALAMEPTVLLFDEPTSALDAELVAEVLEVIRELARDGMTMLIVTHELAFAREIADVLVMMDHGEIVESGSPEQVLTTPRTERARRFFASVQR